MAALAEPPVPAADSYVGSRQCAGCHQTEYQEWRQSHHFHAMQIASPDSVLGNFDNASFRYFDVTSRFYQRDNRYYVETDNSQGKIASFEIAYTFGFDPLQQYLIRFPDGRLQALSVAWDNRSKADGGQRWFHLYPDAQVDHTDPLHWTGSFFNWNSRCAACHSTGLDKNYSQTTDSYDSQWFEINVACESCHGKGSAHLAWAKNGGGDDTSTETDKGWPFSLADTAQWRHIDNLSTLRRTEKNSASRREAEVCATCHSRRFELGKNDVGKNFADTHSLSLIEAPLYYPDGQIREEVYVYGSFLQSKMYQEGVTCSNCHNPHSGKLKIDDNGLCTQCHQATVYDTEKHHFHPQQTAGAQCINCHMTAQTYMGVDDRRDHSFRIPDPIASRITGAPNACVLCHSDQDNAWAEQALGQWYGKRAAHYPHSEIFAKARSGDHGVVADLFRLANDPEASTIIRATALLELGNIPTRETADMLATGLRSDDYLIRLGAVRATTYLPVVQRYQMLQPLIKDPVKSVRIEVARQLAGMNREVVHLPKPLADELTALVEEFIEAENYYADMPGVQTRLGLFYMEAGMPVEAEAAFQHALKLSPRYLAALLNIADLYRSLQRDSDAEKMLLDALAVAPESAVVHYALGLLNIRLKKIAEASEYLGQAVKLDNTDTQYVYAYSLALQQMGKLEQAIAIVEQTLKNHPDDQRLRAALKSFRQ